VAGIAQGAAAIRRTGANATRDWNTPTKLTRPEVKGWGGSGAMRDWGKDCNPTVGIRAVGLHLKV
jgi:hypothetical protein